MTCSQEITGTAVQFLGHQDLYFIELLKSCCYMEEMMSCANFPCDIYISGVCSRRALIYLSYDLRCELLFVNIFLQQIFVLIVSTDTRLFEFLISVSNLMLKEPRFSSVHANKVCFNNSVYANICDHFWLEKLIHMK